MKFSKLFLGVILTGFVFTSCSNDNDDSTTEQQLVIPTTYSFEREGNSTIDFSGQTSRLLMLQEIGNYIKDAGTNSTTASASVLKDMFANANRVKTAPIKARDDTQTGRLG